MHDPRATTERDHRPAPSRRAVLAVAAAMFLVLVLGVGAPAAATGSTPIRPAAVATPAVTVSPSADLVDGQLVEVDVTGFPAGAEVGVVQCPADDSSGAGCLGSLLVQPADGSGSARFDLLLDGQLPAPGGLLQCAPARCVVMAYDIATGASASTPVTFALPASRTVEVTIAGGALALGTDGSVPVAGTLTCDRTTMVSVDVTVIPTGGAPTGSGATGHLEAACGPVPTPYRVRVGTAGPPLPPGQATVEVTVSHPGGPTRASAAVLLVAPGPTTTNPPSTNAPATNPPTTNPTGAGAPGSWTTADTSPEPVAGPAEPVAAPAVLAG